MKSFTKPQLFIITGSNGAGKSTYRQTLFPEEFNSLEIFDGDVFYTLANTSFYKQTRSSKEARKLAEEALENEFLRLVEHHISEHQHFAYEGHFTGERAWKIPERFKLEGFEINMVFCGLETVKMSIDRVNYRVKDGGFHVPSLAIENNYWGNMTMLDKNFVMFDSVEIMDTTESIIQVAKLKLGVPVSACPLNEIPTWLRKGMPSIYKLIEKRDF